MQGLHLTADLTHCQCDNAWLTDADRLLAECVRQVQAAGLQAVNQLAHSFPATAQGPGGVTATILLAESHLCVHTWPEQAGVTVDVYVCNFGADHSGKAQRLMEGLMGLFAPEKVLCQSLRRGEVPAPTTQIAT
jgi:S-adenosylmethionine decarboxylase